MIKFSIVHNSVKQFFLKLFKKAFFWVGVGAFIFALLLFYLFYFIRFGFQPTASIEVTSQPPRATVQYNSRYVGETPFFLQDTKPLRGQITVSLPGYRTVFLDLDKISIEPGENKRVRVDLMLDTKVVITSTPPFVNIYIDGEQWGTTPFTFEGLIAPGTHEVKVELLSQCYGEVKRTIQVQQSYTTTENFELPSLLKLSVTTNPVGAQVEVGDEDWGTTPLYKCIKEGKYKLTISKEGLATEEREIEIKEDTSVMVKLYEPGFRRKKDSFAVDADQPDVSVYGLAKRPNNEVFGDLIQFGRTPAFLTREEMQSNAGISSPPASYVIYGQKEGFSPCITEVFEDDTDVFFPMSILSIFSKGLQKQYQDFPVSSPSVTQSSTSGVFAIDSTREKAVLKNATTGEKVDLYLKDEKDYMGNSLTFSPDDKYLWYFRNNKSVRELVERELDTGSEKVIDKIDPKDYEWSKDYTKDLFFSPFVHVHYDVYTKRLIYLVPGSSRTLTLVSNSVGGLGKRVIYRDLLPAAPQADNFKFWMVSPNVLKIVGVFPGAVTWEGFFHMGTSRPVHFKIRTDPNPSGKVGQIRQLDSGLTLFPSCALIAEKEGNLVMGATLYNKLGLLFMWSPLKKEWEFISLRFF